MRRLGRGLIFGLLAFVLLSVLYGRSQDFTRRDQTLSGIQQLTLVTHQNWRSIKLSDASRDVTADVLARALLPSLWDAAGRRHPFGGAVQVRLERQSDGRRVLIVLDQLSPNACQAVLAGLQQMVQSSGIWQQIVVNDDIVRPPQSVAVCRHAENRLAVHREY